MSTNWLFSINFIEIVTAILATIHFKKYCLTTERYFLYYLWYSVFTETISVISAYIFNHDFVTIILLYDIVSFSFFIFWYFTILNKSINKKILLIAVVFFYGVTIYEFCFLDWMVTNKYTLISGAIVIIIGSFLYFSEILKSNKILNIKEDLRFWIGTGLLLFNVGYIPIEIFKEIFNAHNEVRIIILICLNVILYTCYSLGFIWAKKEES